MSAATTRWSEDDARAAREDGWQLAFTVNSGSRHAFLHVYPVGARFRDPHSAYQHVMRSAWANSKLHQRAVQAISDTTTTARTGKGKR